MWVRAYTCVCVWIRVYGRWRVLARVWPYLSIMPRAGAIFFAASLAPIDFSNLSHKRRDLWKNVTEKKICVLIFSKTLV